MNPIKLLTIDDDPLVSELIRLYGTKEGFEVLCAEDGVSGLELTFSERPDLIVLDIMLPEMDGWSFCRQLRMDLSTPVIMLTGRGESYDRLKGFELGADDYVVKPFDPKELMARIKAVLRRGKPAMQRDVVRTDGLLLDMERFVAEIGSKPVALPPKEMELLYALASHPNRVFTRQQLLDLVWGIDYEGDPRTVDVHIKRIREKIAGVPALTWAIQTIRGIGYKFEVNER